MPVQLRLETNIDEVISNLKALVQETVAAGTQSLWQTAENIRKRMSEAGQPVTYPIAWDSERQRRAFFATNGFGGGIPYTRDHAYERGWKTTKVDDGFLLANSHPAGAIGGMPGTGWQSQIHRGRWPHILTVMREELAKLPGDVIRRLKAKIY